MNIQARRSHRFHSRLLLVVGLLGVLFFAGSASAMSPFGKHRSGGGAPPDRFMPSGRVDEPDEQPQHDHSGISAQEAARQAQSINGGGRVLSVEDAKGGWRVKLLKDGNVRFVFVPQ